MNLPPRPSRGSPPRRAALHERSESHTNERASPTLRIIGHPQAHIYASSPFPTKPSQILSPQVYDGQGSTFGPGVDVSNGREPQSETLDDVEDPLNTVAPSQLRSESGSGSDDTKNAFYAPTQGTTPGLYTTTSFLAMDEGIDNIPNRVSDEIVQLPSVSPGFESSELYGTANLKEAPRQPVSKDSDTSLSSSNSTGTVIVKRNRDGRKRASYSAFPNTARPGSSKSNLSLSPSPKPIIRDMGGRDSPVSPISPSSPVSPGYAVPHERRISSVPMVEPPNSAPRRPSRTLERNQDRWNPHLSTVPSEGTGSQSEGRSSHATWIPDYSRVSKSSFTAMNARGSSDMPPLPSPPPAHESSDLSPLPNPPAFSQRDVTGSTIRVVNDLEDDLPTPLPPIPGSRGSEYLGVASGDNQYCVVTKRGSKASFFRDSIPAWAKAYYARPLSATSTSKDRSDRRPSTSTENISLNMFRPRTSAKDADDQRRQSSLAISRTQVLEDLEKQLGAVDEARYENARWWRNINRVMSGFGVLVLVAVIALVAVAAS
ncbi:MAG: hypothetical protein ASARMPRED_008753 [Alectoria sarmentosa]|nr:MAG: hypothetical protein ASARMPRED_008753 [Alectoria sarmentosa]